jgi:hypothetical protein
MDVPAIVLHAVLWWAHGFSQMAYPDFRSKEACTKTISTGFSSMGSEEISEDHAKNIVSK